MPGVPIKFRCYQCNQLLGVARAKAGAVVSCPKCAAELIVPEPVEAAATSAAQTPGSAEAGIDLGVNPSPAGNAGASDTGLPLEFLDIRPEDIRVEPGARYVAPPPPPPAPAPPAEPPEPSVDEAGADDVALPVRVEETAARPAPVRAPTPEVPPADDESVVPIRLETPVRIVAARRAPAPRPRDLVLPRSVVTAWSLFVLLALAFAFLAGLLAGHFVWRVH